MNSQTVGIKAEFVMLDTLLSIYDEHTFLSIFFGIKLIYDVIRQTLRQLSEQYSHVTEEDDDDES
jgi:hypothetical protein